MENEQNLENQDVNDMVDKVIQEESEEIIFEETQDDIEVDHDDELKKDLIPKPSSNNVMLLILGLLLLGFVFRKQIKEFFEGLGKETSTATPSVVAVPVRV